MHFIKELDWVLEQYKTKNVIFVDCRFQLNQPEEGYNLYKANHLPKARYFDLNKDLSGEVGQTGGRHPLPSLNQFISKLEQNGITNESLVIAYDDQGAMASRFCWLMRFLGHQNTFILDGGYQKWVDAKLPVESGVYKEQANGSFKADLNTAMIADQQYVKDRLHNENIAIVDSRSFPRYAGWEEPIDKKAGHIPSAINFDWTKVVHNGFWKKTDDLREYFASLKPYQEIIVYCGSGVTATPNVLSLYEAGYSNVKLYVGSWSDWISNPDNPIEIVE